LSASRILVDVGSSTTKTYRVEGEQAKLLETVSAPLKEGFSPEAGLAAPVEAALLQTLSALRVEHPSAEITLLGTAIFRKFESAALAAFQQRLEARTGHKLRVLTQAEESRYLEIALAGRYTGAEPVLLINVGGGSTELVVLQNHQNVEEHHLDIGVGSTLTRFPGINGQLSEVSLESVMGFAAPLVPRLRSEATAAFLSGGELTYMRVAGYPLKPNDLFGDPAHPSMVVSEALAQRNQEIYESVTLAELEAMMPDNPTWMHGARAFCALAQQICQKNGITTIVPSDSNMVEGVVRAGRLLT